MFYVTVTKWPSTSYSFLNAVWTKLHPWIFSYGTIFMWVLCLYLKRHRLYSTFCNIPIFAENQPFQQMCTVCFWCWLYVLISCPFYTNTDIDMRSSVMRSWHFPVLFDMRYMMMQSMVAEILSFLSKGHDTVWACNCGEYTLFCWVLPLRNGNWIINRYLRLLYDASL